MSYWGCSSYSLLLCGNTAQKHPEEERVYLAHRFQSIIRGSWGKTSSRNRGRTHGGKLLAGSTFTARSVCCLIRPGSWIQRWRRSQWAGPFHNHHCLRNTYRPTWWKKCHNWGFFFPGGCSLLYADKADPAQGSCGGSRTLLFWFLFVQRLVFFIRVFFLTGAALGILLLTSWHLQEL